MSDAMLFDGVRTPRGRASERGALARFTPIELLTALLHALRARTSLREGDLDDVVLGCASQVGPQGANLARTAALLGGCGSATPGVTLNRFCASGLDAVSLAASRVRAGDAALVLAGGVESVSRVPMFSDGGALFADPAVMAAVGAVHMGVAADLIATLEGFSREELDGFALRTREKARAAWRSGDAARSVVPVDGCAVDEHLAYAPTADALAALPSAFEALGAAGQDAIALARYPSLAVIRHLHSRASSPPMADAAAVVLVGSRAAGERLGLRARARVLSSATCGCDPVVMLTAGQSAAERAIERAGLRPRDIAVFEFAEAFAGPSLRFQRDLDAGDERFNVLGGTMALGHAFGATGTILCLNALDALELRAERYAVAAVSGAAGLGVAVVLERCA